MNLSSPIAFKHVKCGSAKHSKLFRYCRKTFLEDKNWCQRPHGSSFSAAIFRPHRESFKSSKKIKPSAPESNSCEKVVKFNNKWKDGSCAFWDTSSWYSSWQRHSLSVSLRSLTPHDSPLAITRATVVYLFSVNSMEKVANPCFEKRRFVLSRNYFLSNLH